MEDIELVFSKYYKYVKHYALSLCYDETLAEDITQETFYKAFKNIDKFKNECRIETWLCRIAHNEFVSLKRKKKTENIDDYTTLISFDNNRFLDYLDPAVTRVEQPVNVVGKLVTDNIIKMVEKDDDIPLSSSQILIRPTLIEGRSC